MLIPLATLEVGPVRITLHPPPEAPPPWWHEGEPWAGRWLWRVASVTEGGATVMDEAIDRSGSAALTWLETSAAAYRSDLAERQPRLTWYEGAASSSTCMGPLARRPKVSNAGTAGWTWALQGIEGWPEVADQGRLVATERIAQAEAVREALHQVERDARELTARLDSWQRGDA